MVEANPYNIKGTVIAIMGVSSILPFKSDYQGRDADPPIIAKVRRMAEGATAEKSECCMILADLRSAKEERFLRKE